MYLDATQPKRKSYITAQRLLSSTKAQNQMKSTLLLDVVVAERAAILKLLSGEDQALLVWWNALLVLNLALDVIDGI